MTFSYDAGTSTPNLAGLVEIGSIRINDGTFELTAARGLLLGSAAVRDSMVALPFDHGDSTGTPFYDLRDILLEGQIQVPVLDDLWAAIDLLNGELNLADSSLKTLTVNTAGWSAARQCDVRIAGPLEVESPGYDFDLHYRLRRTFTLPLVAPDPRLYSVTEHSQTISTNTSITNAGTMNTPITVRFNGPQTNPKLDLNGTSGSQRIRFTGVITSGHWVEVTTWPTTQAVDDSGDDAYGPGTYGDGISWDRASVFPPGVSAWDASNDAGAGPTVVYWRDAWA